MSQDFTSYFCSACDSSLDWMLDDEPGSLFDSVHKEKCMPEVWDEDRPSDEDDERIKYDPLREMDEDLKQWEEAVREWEQLAEEMNEKEKEESN